MSDRKQRIEALGYDYDAQEKEYLSLCNVCGSEKLTQLTHTDRDGYNASVTACNTCSTTFLNPRMTSQCYTDFYISTYRPLVSAYHGRLIDAVTVQEDQRSYTKELVRLLIPFFIGKSYKTLLDIGGSTGIVALGLMKNYNLKTTLIDPAPDEVDEAKALGIESITEMLT